MAGTESREKVVRAVLPLLGKFVFSPLCGQSSACKSLGYRYAKGI